MTRISWVACGIAAGVVLSSVAAGAPVSAQESRAPARGVAVPLKTGAPRWRTPGILIGSGLAVAGVGVGIGFSVAALNTYSAAFDERNALAFHTLVDHPICPDHASSSTCAPLRALVEARDTTRNVAIAGFAAGGIGVGVALFSAMWRPSRPGPSVAEGLALSIVPSREGVVVTGTF